MPIQVGSTRLKNGGQSAITNSTTNSRYHPLQPPRRFVCASSILHTPCAIFARPRADYPLSRNLCNFPVSVLGSDARNSTAREYLYGATLALTKSCSVFVIASPGACPSRSTTKALTMCPRSSSATPITAHSATAGGANGGRRLMLDEYVAHEPAYR